jgi:hypothetical protein
MSTIIEDNLSTKLQIGTKRIVDGNYSSGSPGEGDSSFNEDALFWDVIEIEVELTQAASPNYVKGKVVPKEEFEGALFDILSAEQENSAGVSRRGLSNLIGGRFRLEAENELLPLEQPDERTGLFNRSKINRPGTPDKKDTLLFDGRLAKISPVGTRVYKVVAYDPGQQAFNIGEESGSLINQKLELTGSSVDGIRDVEDAADNNKTGEHHIAAKNIVNFIIEESPISKENAVINITDSLGEKDLVPTLIHFDKSVVTVQKALDRVREQTRSEFWFEKDGTFYFGDPAEIGNVSTYNLSLITDTSAGITTPPYQSVRVIGSGVSSRDGVGTEDANFLVGDENKRVAEVNVGLPSQGGTQSEIVLELDPLTLNEPTFQYINASLTTDDTIENTALKLADELVTQQASGTVTTVGFAEVEPFDGIRLPDTPNQPMGGQLYDVYAVKHLINPSDGFITKIAVAGPNPSIRGEIDTESLTAQPTSVPRDVYEFEAGAGDPGSRSRGFNRGALSATDFVGGSGEPTAREEFRERIGREPLDPELPEPVQNAFSLLEDIVAPDEGKFADNE